MVKYHSMFGSLARVIRTHNFCFTVSRLLSSHANEFYFQTIHVWHLGDDGVRSVVGDIDCHWGGEFKPHFSCWSSSMTSVNPLNPRFLSLRFDIESMNSSLFGE